MQFKLTLHRAAAHTRRLVHSLQVACALMASLGACSVPALAAPGNLDTTFGAGTGKVITPVIGGGFNRAYGLALQPDGKLVLVGHCSSASFPSRFCLVRYNANGTLDTTLNGTGRVVAPSVGSNPTDIVAGGAVQPDGKIFLAGWCTPDGSSANACVARYNVGGTPDTSWAGTGKLIATFGSGDSVANAITLQPDGKVLLAVFCRGANPTSQTFTCVARYNVDGTPDTTLNGTGSAMIAMRGGTSNDNVQSIILQPDGKIIVAGFCYTAAGNGIQFCFARLNSDGSLDTTLNGTGNVSTAVSSTSDAAFAVALQPDGKILMSGKCFNGSNNYDFCLARFDTDGSFDMTLGGTGKVVTTMGVGEDDAYALAVQPDGKILLAGTCNNGANGDDFCVLRYHANGALDTSMNGGSSAIFTAIGAGADTGRAVALQPDGKIVLAGYCAGASGLDFCLARYEGGPFAYRNCSMDIDGDNRVLATTDSLIHTRIALGITGSAVVNGITFPASATRKTWPLIRDFLVTQCGISLAP